MVRNGACVAPARSSDTADLILANGRVATQDAARSMVQALAIGDGRVLAAGSDAELIDSHSHPIRGGLYYNLELRWDGVPSLADALRMLREQASRTPPRSSAISRRRRSPCCRRGRRWRNSAAMSAWPQAV
jgi:predicted amidohydrolase YtcJ